MRLRTKDWFGVKTDYISSDGLHPSSKGYAVIGDLFYGAIKSVLP